MTRQMSPAFMAARRASRRFDHDECRRLHAAGGWTYPALAAHFGVSKSRIVQILNPETGAAVSANSSAYNRRIAGHCECGTPMTYAAIHGHRRRGNELRCQSCYNLSRATTVRVDTLHCGVCREWKADDQYPVCRGNKARRGRHGFCTACQGAAKQAWRDANPDKVKAAEAAYRDRRNELVRARRAAKRAARA